MVTLEECLIWTEPRGPDFTDIAFSLPGMMDFRGMKADINNYQVGHERFENSFGTIYVACDFCVRYWPKDDSLSYNGFEFRSLHGWPDFRGNSFMVSGLGSGDLKILRTDERQAILAKIGQRKNLRPYLDSFFDWLNESIKVHGKKFYKNLQEKSYK